MNSLFDLFKHITNKWDLIVTSTDAFFNNLYNNDFKERIIFARNDLERSALLGFRSAFFTIVASLGGGVERLTIINNSTKGSINLPICSRTLNLVIALISANPQIDLMIFIKEIKPLISLDSYNFLIKTIHN